MRSPKNKLYVNIKTGVVYHKPEKVNGLAFEAPRDLYEINEDQAARIADGEAIRAVLREGIRERVESELDSTLLAEEGAVEEELEEEAEGVELMNTHEQLDGFAEAKELEFPEGCTTVRAKKDFINTALLSK